MIESLSVELSIVMPVFNRKELVRVMIDSIIANTYQNWELLAIDDGSSDGTYEMLCEYSSLDNRVKPYLRVELPKGPQTCRNKGLELAKGKYVVFFDSDDFIPPFCLQERIAYMKQNPLLDFMVFPFGSYENKECNIYKILGGVMRRGDDVNRFLSRRLPFMVWTNIYKTKALREKKLVWDNRLLSLQDADFNLMAILSGLKYSYGNTEINYFIRFTNNGQSISKRVISQEHLQSHLYAIEKWYIHVGKIFHKSKNKELFKGVLWIYDRVFVDNYRSEFSDKLYQLVRHYDRQRALYLKFIIASQEFLFKHTSLSVNTVRRIVLFPYLFVRYVFVKLKL